MLVLTDAVAPEFLCLLRPEDEGSLSRDIDHQGSHVVLSYTTKRHRVLESG